MKLLCFFVEPYLYMQALSAIKPSSSAFRLITSGCGMTLLAAFMGPFGTYTTMSVWERVLFWSLDVIGLSIVAFTFIRFMQRYFKQLTIGPLLFCAAAFTALPGAAYIKWLYSFWAGSLHAIIPFPLLTVQVFLITLFVLSLHFILIPLLRQGLQQSKSTHPSAVPPPDTSQAPIFEKLPASMRDAKIISISMEDHYAKITTTGGEHMQLMRFSNAIASLGPISGAQIHRSHWVAKEFAKSLEKSGRKHELALHDGRRLPVSSTFLNDAAAMLEAQSL